MTLEPGDVALGRALAAAGAVRPDALRAAAEEAQARVARGEAAGLALVLLERRLVSPPALEAARLALGPALAPAPASSAASSPALLRSADSSRAGGVDARSSGRHGVQTLRYGPYEVVAELARGGMGVVYVVEREGQRYALKSLLPGGAVDPEARVRFRREAELMGRLDHPHIVRVHAADVETEPPWLVQTLLPGGSLGARLRASGPLDAEEVRALGVKLARGLQHAHERGVLHRDLKPENVLFDDRGEPRLVDFGLAEDLARGGLRLTRTGDVLGTPTFMSPEQARGERGDARVDVYGLGALLYALLTGRPPHDGASVFAVVESLLYTDPPRIRSLAPLTPVALEAVLERAMRKERNARHHDMAELARDLEECAPGREPPPPGPAGSSLVRGLGALAVISVGLVVGIVGLAAARRAGGAGTAPVASGAAPDAPAPPAQGGREALRRVMRGEVAPVLSAAWLRDVVAAAEREPARAPPDLIEEAALEALRIAAGDRPAEGATELARRLERCKPARAVLRDVLYRQALALPTATPQQAALRAAAELGPPADDELRDAVVRRWLHHARPGLRRVPDLARNQVEAASDDVVRGMTALAMAQRADPSRALIDIDDDAGNLATQVVTVSRALGRDQAATDFRAMSRLADRLVAIYPEDAGIACCKLALDGVPPTDPAGVTRAFAILADHRRASRGAGPTWLRLHDEIVNELRYRLENQGPDGPARVRALLRQEVREPLCGAKARTLLAEACGVDAALASDVAAARALIEEAQRTLADLTIVVTHFGEDPSLTREAVAIAAAGLDWYEDLPPAERPPLPMPYSITWGREPRVYHLHVDPAVRLRWIPPTTFTMGAPDSGEASPPHEVTLRRGVFLAESEVTVEQYARFLAEHEGQVAVPNVVVAATGAGRAATGMRHEDAMRYCQWVAGPLGTLPPEAHWELAARGRDGERRADVEPAPEGAARPQPVVRSDPQDVSPFGCHDLAGGVEEWVLDPFAVYPSRPVIDPARPPGPDEARIRRGASWASGPLLARKALVRRGRVAPGFVDRCLGFRLAVWTP